jgi:plasmid replication initiation protein
MRFKLSTNGIKLLFLLAERIDPTANLFNEWSLDIRIITQYLGIDYKGKYDVVRDAFFEMGNNPLQYKFITKNGKTKWGTIPWFSAEFDEEIDMNIKIQFHPRIAPYFLMLQENFTKIPIDHLLKLPTKYATWLYPLIKSKYERQAQYKTVVVFTETLDRLKEWVYAEEEKIYSDKKPSANMDFIKRVIGINRNKKTKKWSYTSVSYETKQGKKEKFAGALYEITENTDLNVTAMALKTGREYDRIEFTVIKKTVEKKPKENAPVIKSQKIYTESYLSLEMLKLEYPNAEKCNAEVRQAINNVGKSEFLKSNPTVEIIGTVGNDWYLCKKKDKIKETQGKK